MVAAAMVAVACSDDSVTAPNGPITAGLSQVASNDTGVTNPGIPDGPGYFRGTVLGQSPPGAGNDSLATAPKLGGVVVTIYPRVASAAGTVEHGPEVGHTTTDANGLFQLPTLPAGEYVVTFVPPAGSVYRGAYAFGPLRSNSKDYPWWVVLTRN